MSDTIPLVIWEAGGVKRVIGETTVGMQDGQVVIGEATITDPEIQKLLGDVSGFSISEERRMND